MSIANLQQRLQDLLNHIRQGKIIEAMTAGKETRERRADEGGGPSMANVKMLVRSKR